MGDFKPLFRMPSPAEAKRILIATRSRTEGLIQGLSEARLKTQGQLGGGEWSIKDLLGHLAGYEEQAVAVATGKKPGFDFSKYGSVDERNAADIERKRIWSAKRIREDLDRQRRAVLESIDAIDDTRWESKIPTRDGHSSLGLVLGRLLSGDRYGLFAHDLAHIGDLEKSVKVIKEAIE